MFNKNRDQSDAESANISTRHDFEIPQSTACNHALGIISRIKNHGYQAYLVGGCVRDAVLEISPKDFDVVTNATPEQICRIFSSARIIGRRFKIVHVRAGSEFIEVTTFRDQPNPDYNTQNHSKENAKGLLVRDNVYGTISEDAMRRDFTINSLYYDVEAKQILDFCGGFEDIKAKRLKVIGDPTKRFTEDPVRMLRAVRFSAKLGWELEQSLADVITQLRHLLLEVSSHRMFDEILKLFMNGCAENAYQQLQNYQLSSCIFPPTFEALKQESDYQEIYQSLLINGLINADKRVNQGQIITPGYLFSFLLWPAYHLQLGLINKTAEKKQIKVPFQLRFTKAMNSVIEHQAKAASVPNHFKKGIEEIWGLQNLLVDFKSKRSIDKCYSHKRFRAAYGFLILRGLSGEQLTEPVKFWTDYLQKHPKSPTPYKANFNHQNF